MGAPATVAIAYDCLFPYTTGGGERQYRAFAKELRTRGVQVDYLTARQWSDDAPADDGFTVIAVSGRLRLYDADGVRRIPAALRFAAGLFRALARRRGRYDAIIVSALPVFNVFAARLALLGSRTRLVVDYLEVWHRGQWVEYSGRLVGTVAWMLQRLAVCLTPIATCHSQLSATRLRREGLRSEPIVSPGLIDSAVDAAPVTDAETPPYVLYVGRHIPDKRVEALPAAVADARHRIPALRLIVLGSGPSTDSVRAAVSAVDGGSWIEMPGFVEEARLHRLMHGALCVINPSRREGYGLVVVEANAQGTPVVLVADEGNASTELVDEGTNGFVAPSADPADLAAAIGRVHDAGAALRRSTRAWYDDALRTRTVEKTVDGILTALDGRAHGAAQTKAESA
ncbi:glycosyltransferase family 4 protein [Microbacterium sp. NPDC091313]